MRLNFPTDDMPRRMAKALKRSAEERGVRMKLTIAQKNIPPMFGYGNYQEHRVIVRKPTVTNSGLWLLEDYLSDAQDRLASDNGWTMEFAGELCKPLTRLVELVVLDSTSPGPRPESPVQAARRDLNSRNRSVHPGRSRVRVFDFASANLREQQ